MRKNRNLSIALLICTTNRHESLRICLDKIKNQSLLPDHVVIVEKTSNEEAFNFKEISKFFPKDTLITFKKINSGNVSVSRNIAIKSAKEDILLFVDDDVFLEKNYLKKLLNIYKNNPTVNFVVGRIFPFVNNYWQNFSLKLITSCLKDEETDQIVLHWPTLNFSMRNSVLKKNNLKFDEKYSGLEDISFCLNLKKIKENVFYFASLSVTHNFRNNIQDFTNSFGKYFLNIKKLYLDYPEQDIFNKNLYKRSFLRTFRFLISSFKMSKDFGLSRIYFFGFFVYHFLVLSAFNRR